MNPFGIIITQTLGTDESLDCEITHVATRGMLRERAVRLAICNGRLPHETNKADWESAKAGIMIQTPKHSTSR